MPLGLRAQQILEDAQAKLCVVIIVTDEGPDFDLCMTDPTLLLALPGVLRQVADRIDNDLIEGMFSTHKES